MALSIEKGMFNANTTVGNQTVTLTNSFPIKALILFAVYGASDTAKTAGSVASIGFGTYRSSAVQRGCRALFSAHNAAAGATVASLNTTYIARIYTEGGALDAVADLVSLDTGSFTINWSDAPSIAHRIHYLALGGDEITDALVDSVQIATGAGTQDETVVAGFGKPDLILALCGNASQRLFANDSSSGDHAFNLGVGISNSLRRCTSHNDDDAANPTDVSLYQKAAFLTAISAGGTVDVELDLAAKADWPTDGFRVSKTTAPSSAMDVIYLAIKGTLQATIGALDAPTAGTPPVVEDWDSGFTTPRCAIVWGGDQAASASVQTSGTGISGWILGATDGTNEGVIGCSQEDNLTSDTNTGKETTNTKLIRNYTPSGTGGILQSECDSSFSGSNLRLSWNDIDTVARETNYLILADAPDVIVNAVAAAATAQAPSGGGLPAVQIDLSYTVGPEATAAGLIPAVAVSVDAPVAAATAAALAPSVSISSTVTATVAAATANALAPSRSLDIYAVAHATALAPSIVQGQSFTAPEATADAAALAPSLVESSNPTAVPAAAAANALTPAVLAELLATISTANAATLAPGLDLSITATAAAATAVAPAPSFVAEGGAVSVTAVAATANAAALIPVPHVEGVATTAAAFAIAWFAPSGAPVPSISVAPAAVTATAGAVVPTLQQTSVVTAVAAAATAAAGTPAISVSYITPFTIGSAALLTANPVETEALLTPNPVETESLLTPL